MVKRSRNDGLTNTVTVTANIDFDQNPDDLDDEIYDDNSSHGNNNAVQANGKRSIDSDEAFKQGYVVVIPSM